MVRPAPPPTDPNPLIASQRPRLRHATSQCHVGPTRAPMAWRRLRGVQTGRMGFDVQVVVTLLKPPSEALMSELDHRFGEAAHTHGTKTVEIREHVSMPSEADATEFVRALVLEAIPPGAKITAISATTA